MKMMMMSASSSSSSTLALGFGNHHHCSSSRTKTHVLNKKITPKTNNLPSTSSLHHDHRHQLFRGSSSGTSVPLALLQENDETHNFNPLRRFNFRRREAIGFGLLLGVIDGFVQKPQGVFAATAADDKVQELKCEFTVTNSGLQFCERVVGYGPEATKGQLIKAHYVGKLENGKVFDSSYNRGKPLTFRVGVGEVIKGWDQGIIGGDGVPPMLAGGKRTLKLPPELGYGARGAGCKGGSCIIPPDSVLLFDVEFIGKA